MEGWNIASLIVSVCVNNCLCVWPSKQHILVLHELIGKIKNIRLTHFCAPNYFSVCTSPYPSSLPFLLPIPRPYPSFSLPPLLPTPPSPYPFLHLCRVQRYRSQFRTYRWDTPLNSCGSSECSDEDESEPSPMARAHRLYLVTQLHYLCLGFPCMSLCTFLFIGMQYHLRLQSIQQQLLENE